MSSKKIEFLADRRAKPQRPTEALRALRHMDAALELARDLRLRYAERGHELEEATRLADAPTGLIRRILDRIRPNADNISLS